MESRVWIRIMRAEGGAGRLRACRQLNLPEASTWDDIYHELSRLRACISRGLHRGASWEEIRMFDRGRRFRWELETMDMYGSVIPHQ